jgi:PAS domain S-box-containing protein/excisionase family DNA binding protein
MPTRRPRTRLTASPSPQAAEILDVHMTAELLTVSPDTVYDLFKAGALPGRKVGRKWLTTRRAILRWMESPFALGAQPAATAEPQAACASRAAAGGPGWPANAATPLGEWHFRRLLEKLPAGAYTCNAEGLITYFNPQAVALWGRAPALNDPVDRFCGSFKLFATDGSPITHDQCWMALALTRNEAYNGQAIVIERPDGQRLTALAHANPIHDASGTLLGAVNVLVDISDRQRTEEALREHEARLTVALREKEVLLKEIHHRVKNNLQVVCSLLNLQGERLEDAALREVFQESEQRITTMALIHETLYQVSDMGSFHLAPYVQRLGETLLRAYDGEAGRVTLTTHLEALTLPLDSAVPCGLILHELLSNALKHAFPDGQAGAIRVDLRGTPDRQVTLRVADTGVGVPEGFDVCQSDSLGLQLVCVLTEQLGGTLTVARQGGTVFTLTFPLPATARLEATATEMPGGVAPSVRAPAA